MKRHANRESQADSCPQELEFSSISIAVTALDPSPLLFSASRMNFTQLDWVKGDEANFPGGINALERAPVI